MKQYLAPKWLLSAVVLPIFLLWILSVYWSLEPELFDPEILAKQQASQRNESVVAGYTITTSLIKVTETLLNKSGGYLSNDVLPPSVMMDNMPSWEFGALEMTRDLALAMRQDFSRSQSQSLENPFLTKAQPQFNINNLSWILPSSESAYQDGIDNLYAYRSSLSDSRQQQGQFYARADNLRDWLKQLEKRLGSFSQRLSASVGQERLDTNLAGDAQAIQSTPTANRLAEKTSWWQLDDNFYEARGASWALLHFLKAVEVDFSDVLEKTNYSRARGNTRVSVEPNNIKWQWFWYPGQSFVSHGKLYFSGECCLN
jgi:hypothetical protein